MAELATRPRDESVEAFIASIENDTMRHDCLRVIEIMRDVTGESPRIWGSGMVGFGSYRYRYDSGREGEWFITGFSPRKANLTLYLMAGFEEFEPLLAKLGKHKTGKSCLYVKRLDDIDESILRELIASSVRHTQSMWPYRHQTKMV